MTEHKVLLFGELRYLLQSQDTITIQLDTTSSPLTPRALWQSILTQIQQHHHHSTTSSSSSSSSQDQVQALLDVCLLAIDDDFVAKDDTTPLLRRPKSIAVIPPVSGG